MEYNSVTAAPITQAEPVFVAPVEPKGALQSATLWFNGVVGAIALALPQLEMAMPVLTRILPESIAPYLVAVLTIGNALLRLRTSQPVTLLKR